MAKRKVPVNEHGQPLGESRRDCTVPDAVVVQIRDMREYEKLTLPEIARRTGVKQKTVEAIVYYRRRSTVPRGWKDVEDDGE